MLTAVLSIIQMAYLDSIQWATEIKMCMTCVRVAKIHHHMLAASEFYMMFTMGQRVGPTSRGDAPTG